MTKCYCKDMDCPNHEMTQDTTDNMELKPCPFCGVTPELEQTERIYGGDRFWGVVCRSTKNLGGSCAIEQIPSRTKEAAAKRWNTRATQSPAIADTTEERQRALDWFNRLILALGTIYFPGQNIKTDDPIIETIRQSLQTPSLPNCEICENTRRIEVEPDSEETHPCDTCQPELNREYQRGRNTGVPVEIADGLADALQEAKREIVTLTGINDRKNGVTMLTTTHATAVKIKKSLEAYNKFKKGE